MLTQLPLAHTEVVTSLTFSPHACNVLCSTSGDDTAALWDVQGGGANIARLRGHHRGPVNDAVFLPNDANVLLTASDDRTIALWDSRHTARPLAQLTGFHDGVNRVKLLPASLFPSCGLPVSGREGDCLVASACDDGRVYVHTLVPLSLASMESGGRAAAGALLGAARSGLPSHGAQATTTTAREPPLMSAGTLVDCFWASTSTVNDLLLLPDNQSILTASEDGALRTWRLLFNPTAPTEERLLCSLDEFDNPVNHAAVVPQGWMREEDGGDRGAGSQVPPATGSGGQQGAPAGPEGSPSRGEDEEGAGDAGGDGDTAGAVGAHDGASRLQREEEEREGLWRWVLAGCSEFVFAVDISVPTGEFGQGARSFVGHGDYVRGLEFTKQGTLLTVSDDGTAMEWNLSSGEPIRQVKLHDGLVMASALNGTRELLATGTDRGEIRVWQLPFQTEPLGGVS